MHKRKVLRGILLQNTKIFARLINNIYILIMLLDMCREEDYEQERTHMLGTNSIRKLPMDFPAIAIYLIHAVQCE